MTGAATSKFTEDKLESAIIALLGEQGYPHLRGDQIDRASYQRSPDQRRPAKLSFPTIRWRQHHRIRNRIGYPATGSLQRR